MFIFKKLFELVCASHDGTGLSEKGLRFSLTNSCGLVSHRKQRHLFFCQPLHLEDGVAGVVSFGGCPAQPGPQDHAVEKHLLIASG